MKTTHQDVMDDLAGMLDGEHAAHLAECDDCRDARHEVAEVARTVEAAGADYVASDDMLAKVMARLDAAPQPQPTPAPQPQPQAAPQPRQAASRAVKPQPSHRTLWAVAGAMALAAGATGLYVAHARHDHTVAVAVATGPVGKLTSIARAAADHADGVRVRVDGGAWQPLRTSDELPRGAELATDERTRATLDLADGTHLVLDHQTTVSFDRSEPRHVRVAQGRLLADVTHIADRPARITTPGGTIDVVGTRFVVTATDALTSVQVVRGEVVLRGGNGAHDSVRAGEEGTIDHGTLAVSPVPSLAHDVEWAEGPTAATPDETTAGLGALRAYKPGESRDRDWNLALAKHDVKVRIVGPIARTEITETFRNDSATELEGVYQFPMPGDAQIDALALDNKDAPNGFIDGAFVDKQRGAKIWKGVIDKATHKVQLASDRNEIIWVDGSWRDPALLDWKRGGRFELRIFPIPAHGQRTIKIAYTQVVEPRGAWRQYVYPLPHSKDGSTVADQMSVDVEIRGAEHGLVRTVGYDLAPDPARGDVNALTMTQSGFVPRGDLVVAYRATDGNAELRAWTASGGAAIAPDAALAEKKNVGNDDAVIAAQRAEAADARPTAVLALRPNLPRWRETRPRDVMIVLDASQSMVGERFTRAGELAQALVDQMDRRDRFGVMTCDSDCRSLGDLRSPGAGAKTELAAWLKAQQPAGATDIVASIRAARTAAGGEADREKWVIYVGDGFASTGFRRVADVEKALAGGTVHVTTIGIGGDADAPVLEAAARGGGGSFLAWHPGERAATAAMAALESTYGSALRDAKIELPAGLADVAPTTLPTIRAGEEVLVAARMTGDVQGDVVVKGTVAGQPFEQHYPVHLAASASAGNSFVPRLWASLAIGERERAGTGEDRAKIVALSQAYGVMSRETSLLVLESQAMFDAFGVDRHVPTATWTGEEQLDEVAAAGTLPVAKDSSPPADEQPAKKASRAADKGKLDLGDDSAGVDPAGGTFGMGRGGFATGGATGQAAPATATPPAPPPRPAQQAAPCGIPGCGGMRDRNMGGPGAYDPYGGNMVAMRRTWVRVPTVSPYDTVNASITKSIGDAERALAKNPDSREKHRALVQALAYAGELDRARDLAAKWLDRDRLDPQALGYEADLLGRAGERELALRTLAGLVDLDADRPALHERMVQAYEQVGKTEQACSHRIALAALAPTDAKPAAAAMRCLRTLGHSSDAELISRALPDDATRAAAEQAAAIEPVVAKAGGDLVVNAAWHGGADLDISLITPEGARVSWMGGRADATVTDATSTDHEQLAVKSLRKGNYLVEVTRAAGSTDAVKGTLDITVLGTKKSLPFELRGPRAVIGRVSVSLQESLEAVNDVATGRARMAIGSLNIPDENLAKVVLARSTDVRRCFQQQAAIHPDLAGHVVLVVRVAQSGGMSIDTRGSDATLRQCVVNAYSSMHGMGKTGFTFTVAFQFTPR